MRIRLDFKFSIHYYTAFPLVSTLYFFNEMLLVPLIKLLCTQWTERCQSPYKPLLKHVTSREARCIDWEGPWQTLYNFYLVPLCPSIEWNGAGEESGTGAWAPLRYTYYSSPLGPILGSGVKTTACVVDTSTLGVIVWRSVWRNTRVRKAWLHWDERSQQQKKKEKR